MSSARLKTMSGYIRYLAEKKAETAVYSSGPLEGGEKSIIFSWSNLWLHLRASRHGAFVMDFVAILKDANAF